jgi:hypothetical protein
MGRLESFSTGHDDSIYNTVGETHECRAHPLQHDFVEIDHRSRNGIVLSGVDCIEWNNVQISQITF